jgi:hypothetical protein
MKEVERALPPLSTRGENPLQSGDLDRFYVGCRLALRPFLNIKGYCLAFLQAFEAAILDSTEMHEHVASVFSFDKAEPFAIIEPFNFSLHRRFHPPFVDFFKAD